MDLQLILQKESGTGVKLSWDLAKDPRKINWKYGIYYGVTEEEVLSGITVFRNYCCKYSQDERTFLKHKETWAALFYLILRNIASVQYFL